MATRQYIGARYVPKFADPIAWDEASSYEALTIVTYLGTSYTSKKPVPAGTAITNTEYWAATGNYNAQVEAYRQEVEAVAADYDEIAARRFVNRGRAKAFWKSATDLSLGVYATNMTGFRFLGRDYVADGSVYIPAANRTVLGHAFVTSSDTEVTAFNTYCWQAIFGIVDPLNTGYYKMCVVPVMEVLSIADGVITVGKTTENTTGASLTGEINDNIEGREVLVITRNNKIAGDVTTITAYTGTTIELDDDTDITAGDYLLIAPEEAGKYVYFASHYFDGSSWRNREDDGVTVYTRNVANDEHTYAEIKASEGANYTLKNCVSPLATGVIVNGKLTLSTSSTGTIQFSIGAEYAHRKYWFSLHKQSSDATYVDFLPNVWVGFDHLRQVNVSVTSSQFSDVSGYQFNAWAFTEP